MAISMCQFAVDHWFRVKYLSNYRMDFQEHFALSWFIEDES